MNQIYCYKRVSRAALILVGRLAFQIRDLLYHVSIMPGFKQILSNELQLLQYDDAGSKLNRIVHNFYIR